MISCCTCGVWQSDAAFYTNGPGRRMSECKACNRERKAKAYVPKPRDYSTQRRIAGKFARAA